MNGTLTIAVNGEYFDQIKAGIKPEEYRLDTPYWSKRLDGREYDNIVLTRGYPKRTDLERRLVLPWRGVTRKTLTHPHFGSDPVKVFAILVTGIPHEFTREIERLCTHRCAKVGDPVCWQLPNLVQPCELITPCQECENEVTK